MADTILDTAATTGILSLSGVTFGTIDATPMSGSFNTSLDQDWYAVTLTAGHTYTFSALATSGNLNDLAIDLSDANRNIVNSQGVVDGGANREPQFTYTATVTGTYYVAISAGGSNPASLTGTYDIQTVGLSATSDTVLDTAATAGTMTVGVPLIGNIDGAAMSGSFDMSLDHDWYAVSLTAGHTYSFTALPASGNLNDLAIYVSDANRNILDSQSVVDGGPNHGAQLTYTATVTGTYYFAISAGGSDAINQSGSYDVISKDLGGPVVDTVLDTAATTASLTIDYTTNGVIDAAPESGSFNTSRDYDWYAVFVTAGEHYTFSASGTAGGLSDVAIDLSDANRNILNSQGVVDGGLNGTATLTYTPATTATVYLEISAGGSNPTSLSGGYQIQSSVYGNDTILDTPATTASLTMNSDVGGFIEPVPESGSFDLSLDHDWFKVSLTGGHTYQFLANGGVVNVNDIAIDLRDASRNIVNIQGVVDGGPNGDASFFYTAPATGTYYLDVSPGGTNPQGQPGSYDVSVVDFGFQSPDTILDTPATTATLTMNGTSGGAIDLVPESGSFNTSLDHDWFAVSLTAGHSYSFTAATFASPPGLSYVAIDLRDASRNIVDTQGVVDSWPIEAAAFTFQAATTGTYYLDVSAGGPTPAGSAGGYSVGVTDVTEQSGDMELDTAATTGILAVGATLTGTINATPMSGSFDTSLDHDWYAVSVTRGELYELIATPTRNTLSDVAISVMDANRNILDAQGVVDSGSIGSATLMYTAASTGTVYFAIGAGGSNPASLTGSYQINSFDLGTTVDTILDTASTTATLTVGSPVNGNIYATPMSGSFDTTLDHDWYAVNLLAGHRYTFSAGGVSGGLNDVAIDLSDANRNILDSQGIVDGGTNGATFTYTAAATGTFYLAIGAGGSNPASLTGGYQIYAVDLSLVTDTVLDTASTTATLSNVPAGGTSISSSYIDPTPMSGSFDTTLDHDWYSVNLLAGHHYAFSGVGTPGGGLNDVAIDLNDANRNILDSQGLVDGGTNGTATFIYTPTAAGTVYLAIGAGGSDPAALTGGYTVSVKDLGTQPLDTILDTASTTGVLAAGGTISSTIDAMPMSGSFDTTLDHDWFAVSMTRGHTYEFLATPTSGNLNDIATVVMDANRNVLDTEGVVDSTQRVLIYTAGSTGTAYLAVSAGGNNPAGLTGGYQITALDLGANTDTVLDTAATTATLQVGVPDGASGSIDATPMSGSFDTSLDHDWFAVNLTAGHHYTFSAVGATGGLNDVAIDLSDASRNILNSQGVVDGGTNGTATFTYTAAATGTFYLAIGAGGSNPADLLGGYEVTAIDNGGDTVIDTAATTASLPPNGIGVIGAIDAVPTAGSFNTSLDHDWYAVPLTAGHTYTFTGMPLSGSLNDVAIDLRDANRNILDRQGVVDGGLNGFASFHYTATASGTDYLDISAGGSNPAGLAGSYQVFVNDLGALPPDTVLDTAATTASLTMNRTVTGTIDLQPASGSFNATVDHDWYAVNLTAGERYTFSALGTITGGLNDVAIALMNANRTVVDTQGVVDGGNGNFSVITFTAPTTGTYYLAVGAGGSNPANASGGYQLTTTDNGPSHLVINLVADQSVIQQFGANYQTSTFWTAVESAASYFESNFYDPITVTINVGWGEVAGTAVPSKEAESRKSFTTFSFSQIVAALRNDATSASDATAIAHLPTQDPGPGGNDFRIGIAEAKALGLNSGAGIPSDGSVGFATDWNPTDANFVGVAEHEISEVLGRGSGITASTGVFSGAYSILDLFRYAAGPITPEPSSALGPSGQSTYFSIDGGVTALNTFSSTAGHDPGGDWVATGSDNDAFDSTLPHTQDVVTANDKIEMDVLGYDTQPAPIPVTSGGIDYRVPVVVGSATVSPTTYIGAAAIASAGYRFAIEYIGTADNAGYLRANDSSALVQQGLPIVSVYAKTGMSDKNADGSYNNAWVGYFNNNGTLGQGTADAIDAINAAKAAGQTSGAIYFAVNLDPADARSGITQAAALAEIDEYVREINTYFTQNGAPYSIGVYGAGATLSSLQADPSAGVTYTWLADTWLNETSAVTSKNLEQTDTSGGAMVGGQAVDLDTAYTSNFGQWNAVTRSGVIAIKNDFDGSRGSDILLQNSSNGSVVTDEMNGAQVTGSAAIGGGVGWTVAATGDFNGDSDADILLYNPTNGNLATWEMHGTSIAVDAGIDNIGTVWRAVATGDFNGDGKSDILLYNPTNGNLAIREMNGTSVILDAGIGNIGTVWKPIGTGDFNGDGKADILLFNPTNGNVAAWEMNGPSVIGDGSIGNIGTAWKPIGTGDFNGDGKSDILLFNPTNGNVAAWQMNGLAVTVDGGLGNAGPNMTPIGTGDYNGDGKADILFQSSDGTPMIWTMNGTTVMSSTTLANPGPNWHATTG
jgi:hypothetical protein